MAKTRALVGQKKMSRKRPMKEAVPRLPERIKREINLRRALKGR